MNRRKINRGTRFFIILKINFNIIIPSMPQSSKWSLSFRLVHQTMYVFVFLSVCATWPIHLILLDLMTEIFVVQTMKLLIMQFSPVSCSFLPLSLTYLPQHHILEHPQPMFFPQCKRPSFTPIWKYIKTKLLYVYTVMFLERKGEDRIYWTKLLQAERFC